MRLFAQIWMLAVLEMVVLFLAALYRAKAPLREFGPLVFGFIWHCPKPSIVMFVSLGWFNLLGLCWWYR
jgi:hypothetical protein